jgi:serine/threonine-protein kinase
MAAAAAPFGAGQGPRALTMAVPAPESVIEVGGVEDVAPSRRGRAATVVLALPLLLVLLVGLALDQAGIGPFADPGAPSTAAGLTVPMLVGTPADEARAALEGLGLHVQEVRRAHGVVPAGLVITTEPGPGSLVGPGQTVRLVVSSGPTQAPVPSVVDKPGPAAEAALVEAGFPCEVRQVQSDRPAGTVLAQEPPAGRRLPPGRKVVLTVAAPKPGTGGGGTGGGGTGTTTPGAGGGVPATTVAGDGGGRDPGGGGRDPDGGPGTGTTSPPDTDPPVTVPPTTLPETTVPPVTEATIPPTTADPNGRGDTVLDSIPVTLPEISIRRIL